MDVRAEVGHSFATHLGGPVLNYPLYLNFKLIAIAPQVKVVDAAQQTVLYVRQKALALREDVRVFSEEAQTNLLYQINADRIIDWSAKYTIRDASGMEVGSVKRKGMRSIFNTDYRIENANGEEVGKIKEESAWTKVLDSLAGEVPLVGFLLTMMINPAYLVEYNGAVTLRLAKKPAFFEGKFEIEKVAELDEQTESLLVPSVLMMLMLERQRG